MKAAHSYMVQLLCSSLLLLCFCFFTGSCRKFVTIPPPVNEVGSSSVFSNDGSAISAVAGIYSDMMVANLSFINGGFSVFNSLSADDIYNTSPNSTLDPFTNNDLLSTDFSVGGRLWTKGYEMIYDINACLEGLSRSSGISDSLKKQLRGEVLTARAICHFYLLQLFGDIPLVTTTDYRINAVMPRIPGTQVYEQIKNDLQEASLLLPTTYTSNERARPNKWAARALLARVFLYKGDWVNAENEANNVIQSGQYSIVTNLANVFLNNSNETIWQLVPVLSTTNTAEGNAFVPSSATVKPTYAITNGLLTVFETNDQRKINWTKTNTISGVPYVYPYKYKVRTITAGSARTEYNIVLRFAEQYLIRAEARAQQNNIDGSKNDINIIRSRAGLVATTANDQTSLLAAIAKERRTEYFAEMGHRWMDLKRTNKADAVIGALKSSWQTTDALYPIPFAEIRANPFLVQNPGY